MFGGEETWEWLLVVRCEEVHDTTVEARRLLGIKIEWIGRVVVKEGFSREDNIFTKLLN